MPWFRLFEKQRGDWGRFGVETATSGMNQGASAADCAPPDGHQQLS
jgi:hypothetical protein